MGLFNRPPKPKAGDYGQRPIQSEKLTKYPSPENPSDKHVLPTYEENGRLVTKGINPEGESGRSGIHPFHFFRIAGRSATRVNMILNILWPFVPAAMALYWARPEMHVAIFACSYIGMVPAASLLGFAGQEFARKLPRVAGILIETVLGGVVEIVLFMILIVKHKQEFNKSLAAEENGEEYEATNYVPVIQAAILGSILANLLLCLGACFLVGGIKHKEQTFHGVVSEVGSGLLLVAGFALLIPSAFFSALNGHFSNGYTAQELQYDTVTISEGTSIILMFSFVLYVCYSAFSHDSIFDEALAHDEKIDRDRESDLARSKLTLFESIFAIIVALACISLLAYFLISQIEPLVQEHGVKDNFLGLILVPLVEKIAEHLTAVDEAYDNQIVSIFPRFSCTATNDSVELCSVPLLGPVHPNCPVQRSSGGPCGMGYPRRL